MPPPLNFQNVAGALSKAQKAWEKYDMDKSGTLPLPEVTELLNSPEIRQTVLLLTNVEPSLKTEEDLKDLFKKADSDKSGQLSRSEFLGLYMAIVGERLKTSPLVLAEALLGFLDVDRNGKIDGTELKVLLAMLGFPAAMLLPIPRGVGIDYRSVIKSISNMAGQR
ncbi:hypothetical protein CEUSTIGMA_g93.t1 [Chlamydomonas eustigma]|uniref:EF-hand domain-containing protein n=1 Tax=Chlamydomonas eustigma TaxID=1157962 RepID=A0A250WP74_9CHLO|nr:hypothetical protein CEUSTIGMA_g93.t1 [Chlamydomonas eustigma]|eukprot:GAX72637.1 hypothetical protein CEUSTIGMA_g93.t1 [Chlamydomonas eustigma]